MKPVTFEEQDAIANMHKTNLSSNYEEINNLKLEKEELKEALRKLKMAQKKQVRDIKYTIRYINILLIKQIFSVKKNTKKLKKSLK